jgi:hypothetical protein
MQGTRGRQESFTGNTGTSRRAGRG